MKTCSSWLKFSLAILLLLQQWPAQAKNSAIVSFYSSIANNRDCSFLGVAGQNDVFKKCPSIHQDALAKVTGDANDIFEWGTFQLSAQAQIKKNKCLVQRMNYIESKKLLMENGDDKEDNAYMQWLAVLSAAWIGKRKADLMLNKCEEVNFQLDPINHARGFARVGAVVDPKWKELCQDEDVMAGLAINSLAFENSLPTLGNEKFFDILDKEKGALVDHHGKPITDEYLLKLDASDLSGIDINPVLKKEVLDKLNEPFRRIKNERQRAADGIKETKTGKAYDLTQAQKDYMYEDSTVMDVLRGKEITETTGARCILNDYELSAVGEMVDIAVWSAFSGAVVFRLLKYRNIGQLVAKVKKIKKFSKLTNKQIAFQLGGVAGGVISGQRAVRYSRCVSDLYGDVKVEKQSNNDEAIIDAGSMPKEVGFARAYTEIPRSYVPDCFDENEPRCYPKKNARCAGDTGASTIMDFGQSNCALEALMNFGPMQLALPAAAISIMTDL